MCKYFLCFVMVMGCSSASFDLAPLLDEDSGCIQNCLDSRDQDSLLSETDSLVEPSKDSETDSNTLNDSYVPDTNVIVISDTSYDTKITDTYIVDTYVSPPVDIGPGCIPKTCSSLLSSTGRQPCGVIPDGCGGTVSCPTVCANHKESCGGSAGFTSSPVTLATTTLPKTPYQCSGDCAYITTATVSSAMCPTSKLEMWRCSNAFSFNPFTDCVAATNLMYPYTTPGPNTLWCCPSNLEIK